MDEERNGSSEFHLLEQNCRDDWPLWVCIFGNICGLCSTTLWFLVLLPQVWKNFRRKSVKGLSVLWATANFSASLINLFFVFMYAHIPLYGQISSVYCPVLEFTLLIQFWLYGRYRTLHKVLYLCACVILWGLVIAVEFLFSVENTVEYVAITLWCIETFPQVILNMRLQSTSGQSFGSVFIAMLGKTTDFVTNNVLVLPLQYVIMTYFSSSVAYINGLQVAWYYGNDIYSQSTKDDTEVSVSNKAETIQSQNSLNSSRAFGSTSPLVTNATKFLGFRRVNKRADACRVCSLGLLLGLLSMCVVGFVWNIKSLYGLFAPVTIACVLLSAYAYLWKCKRKNYSMSSMSP